MDVAPFHSQDLGRLVVGWEGRANHPVPHEQLREGKIPTKGRFILKQRRSLHQIPFVTKHGTSPLDWQPLSCFDFLLFSDPLAHP